jgi:hypothetical protein
MSLLIPLLMSFLVLLLVQLAGYPADELKKVEKEVKKEIDEAVEVGASEAVHVYCQVCISVVLSPGVLLMVISHW